MNMFIKLFLPLLILLQFACGSSDSDESVNKPSRKKGESPLGTLLFLIEAPVQAQEFRSVHYPVPGRKVLALGQKIAFIDREVIVGHCYKFVDEVYNRSGYTNDRRKVVFSGDPRGPYADPKLVRPGDWIMHVNLEFNNVGHSCIFVRWLDRKNHVGCMLDYAGMMRREPATYRAHQLTKIFTILRGQSAEK